MDVRRVPGSARRRLAAPGDTERDRVVAGSLKRGPITVVRPQLPTISRYAAGCRACVTASDFENTGQLKELAAWPTTPARPSAPTTSAASCAPRRCTRPATSSPRAQITAEELTQVEDEAIREAIRMQGEVGLKSATDGELRRQSWHMDFIYQLGGIEKVQDDTIKVAFHNKDKNYEWAPPSAHVTAPVSLPETIFADAFTFVRDNVAARPDPEAHDPLAVHGPLPGRPRRDRRGRLPRPDPVLGRPRRRLRRGDQAAARARLPVPAARRHQPRLRQRPGAARARQEHRRRPAAPARDLHRHDQQGAGGPARPT